jgi:hypothetical protein
MANTKFTGLTEDTSPAVDSIVPTIDDPGGTPAERKVTLANLAKGLGSATLTHQTDEASAQVLSLVGPTRATSADDDETYISFSHDVDDGVEEQGRITCVSTDVSTGTEDSDLLFDVREAGVLKTRMTVSASAQNDGVVIHSGDGSTSDYIQLLNSGTGATIRNGTGQAGGLTVRSQSGPLNLTATGAAGIILALDGTVGTEGQVVLPSENLAATPTLAFGDGNCGFFEAADNELSFSANGSEIWRFNPTRIRAINGTGPQLLAASPTDTAPNINPSRGDGDTGLGSAAADQLSLIAGGVESLRITEASTISTFDFDAGDNAAPQVGALTSLKSVSATVTAATAATLTASNLIPAGSFVIGLTLRVETEFDNTASLTTFSVGDGSDADRWGTAIARTAGTTVDLTDATASPGGWFIAANDVVLTADAGTFHVNGGSADIIIHYMDLTAATG